MGLELVLDIASWACIVLGALVALTGALGMLRLPDVFSRMHAAGMIDSMGMAMILTGLMFQADEWIVVVKLGLIVIFILLTSPTTTFALARAAIDSGLDPGPHDDLPGKNNPETAKTAGTTSSSSKTGGKS